MLDRINPFFKSFLRRTETTDTRKHIRREESKITRRNKEDDGRRRSLADAVEDHTEVSIQSLVSFLSDMLKENTVSAQEQSFSSMADTITNTDFEDAPASPEKPSQENRDIGASRAASAYQTTATKIEAPNYSEGANIKPEDTAHAVELDAKDRKTLEAFLTDLNNLLNQGVETLNISRAGTFFESLRDAIEVKKNG